MRPCSLGDEPDTGPAAAAAAELIFYRDDFSSARFTHRHLRKSEDGTDEGGKVWDLGLIRSSSGGLDSSGIGARFVTQFPPCKYVSPSIILYCFGRSRPVFVHMHRRIPNPPIYPSSHNGGLYLFW